MGIGIEVEGLTKSFGPQRIWEDVTFEIPAGEVSVLLGPSGTGKSVFLKSLIGLLRPERGKIIVDGTNIIECSAKELYEIRTLFGVMFQDGALFGSMSLYDNTAFPCVSTPRRRKPRSATSSWRSSSWSAWAVTRRSSPVRSPAVCASAQGWPARWCSTRRSSCATSRTPVWTRSVPLT